MLYVKNIADELGSEGFRATTYRYKPEQLSMNGGHTPVEKKGSPLSDSCCTWSLKSTIPALLFQGCSVLINDYSHVNVLLPSSPLTSIHTVLIHKVSSFTGFECFLETLFVLFCLQDIWLIYRDQDTDEHSVGRPTWILCFLHIVFLSLPLLWSDFW